ncbi:MAG: HEAT repeat domain-containing protein [Planctomycetota bacterium]
MNAYREACLLGLALTLVCASGCDQALDTKREDTRVRDMAASWPPYRAPYVPDAMIEAGQNVADQLRSINRPSTGSRPEVDSVGMIRPYTDWDMEQTVRDSLRRIGAPAVPRLRMLLQSDDPAQREQAAELIARIGPEASAAVPDLIAALEDSSPKVRKTAARALGQIGPEAAPAVEALFRIIQEDNAAGGRSSDVPPIVP